jgi:hypothetical protein
MLHFSGTECNFRDGRAAVQRPRSALQKIPRFLTGQANNEFLPFR